MCVCLDVCVCLERGGVAYVFEKRGEGYLNVFAHVLDVYIFLSCLYACVWLYMSLGGESVCVSMSACVYVRVFANGYVCVSV